MEQVIAAIYNEAGKVIAEGDAQTDPETGRPVRAIVLEDHAGVPVTGALIGYSGGLVRYQAAVTPDEPDETAQRAADAGSGLGEAQASPTPRRRRKATSDE